LQNIVTILTVKGSHQGWAKRREAGLWVERDPVAGIGYPCSPGPRLYTLLTCYENNKLHQSTHRIWCR